MKKFISLALCAILILATLTACGTTSKNKSTYTIGLCNYANDASLNQIAESIQAQLAAIGKERGVTFDVKYQNSNADSNVLNQIVSNFIADDVDLMVKNYGVRIKNGLATEHTLYAYGEKLWSSVQNDGHKTTASTAAPWVSFAEEDAPVALESTANTVDIKASASYRTVFKYDAAKGKYTRYYGNTIRKDYFTGETVDMKNVFILFTTIRNYSDNYHRQVMLESGDGYYCVNGTYTAIKWSKGAAKNGFKFTKADGSELTVNPGNSWVSIVNIGNNPTFS